MMKSRLGINDLKGVIKVLTNDKELQNRLQEDDYLNKTALILSVIFLKNQKYWFKSLKSLFKSVI